VPPSGPHDEFLELCALSTSGQLNRKEQARLQEHLSVCSSCREALEQYQAIVDEGIPNLVSEELETVDPGPGWSQSKAEKAFFQRLAREEKRTAAAQVSNGFGFQRSLPVAPESTWRHVWMLYAAGVLLFITLSLTAYWVGVRRGTDSARGTPPFGVVPQTNNPTVASSPSLAEQLSDAAHERMIARQEIAKRDKALAGLRQQLTQQSAEIDRLKEAQRVLETNLRTDEAGKQDLLQQRADLAQKLDAAQSDSRSLQHQVASLTQQSTSETAHVVMLEAKLTELTQLLDQRNASLNQQDELLAHDRDIRELMGARDLYIAEVFDVDDHGTTRKPYGRVFYTKGKSLIFYAYDLDQLGTKRAQAFQAWGRRGPDWNQALNLGVFYEDNASKKRWVLKLDDPKTLAQIEGVFVTVEPRGGSEKPSGKPLLSAYLRLNPNHP
jgi:hypothetical protein